ncbi:MAG: DNA-binding protein [Oscillospiraceae bacterium]|nr:DNA-binding protein [Oscillospiraceae bacterium]
MLKLKQTLEASPIGLKGYAKLLDMADKTLYNKLTGASDFTDPEYRELRKLLPEYNIDYLLTEDSA